MVSRVQLARLGNGSLKRFSQLEARENLLHWNILGESCPLFPVHVVVGCYLLVGFARYFRASVFEFGISRGMVPYVITILHFLRVKSESKRRVCGKFFGTLSGLAVQVSQRSRGRVLKDRALLDYYLLM